MKITPTELAERMAEKTDQQLRDMFVRPANWSSQALDAARAELQKRNIPPVETASQPANDELLRRASRMYSLDEEARLALTAELERRSIGPDEIQSYIDSEAAKTTIKEIPAETSIWSFEGRIGRSTFWIRLLLLSLGGPAVVIFCGTLQQAGEGAAVFSLLILLVGTFLACWIGLAMSVKRWHDMNRSGWHVLLAFTIVGIPFGLIMQGCVKGTAGPNQYGSDPLGAPSMSNSPPPTAIA